jgi:hypothetical protein
MCWDSGAGDHLLLCTHMAGDTLVVISQSPRGKKEVGPAVQLQYSRHTHTNQESNLQVAFMQKANDMTGLGGWQGLLAWTLWSNEVLS